MQLMCNRSRIRDQETCHVPRGGDDYHVLALMGSHVKLATIPPLTQYRLG